MALLFPTALHHQVAETIARKFAAHVDTVLIVNSCARGVAVPESDLDMALLLHRDSSAIELEMRWNAMQVSDPLITQFRQSGRFMHVHLDFITGVYMPQELDDSGGPDSFEIEIGNQIAYAQPFKHEGAYFRQLKARWLPFYEADLRLPRLTMICSACLNDIDHVPFFVRRELYFQAFDRLYKAYQEFLQALFIAKQVYPIAYNKWIREQVERWLGWPELYRQLTGLLSIHDFESAELEQKATLLQTLLVEWTGQ